MYDPELDGRVLAFANSGWLYQSSVVPYDLETGSLWSQVDGRALGGKLMGKRLAKLPSRDTTWGAWRTAHPDTLVLSADTGHARMYGVSMYTVAAETESSAGPPYPVTYRDSRLPDRTLVYGVEVDGEAKAYSAADLAGAPARFTDRVGGQRVQVSNSPPGEAFAAFSDDGEEIPSQRMYWFAWVAYHRDTGIFRAQDVVPTAP